MRRFLISYNHPRGFGSVYINIANDGLPTPADLVDARNHAADALDESPASIVVLAVSEVSAEGPVIV